MFVCLIKNYLFLYAILCMQKKNEACANGFASAKNFQIISEEKNMKRIVSLFLVLVMVAMMVPTLPLTAATEKIKIEPDGESVVYFPFDTYYMGGNTYKKYVIGGDYKGLTVGDIIFVDANDYLITDRTLIEKMLFTNIIRQNINARTHAIEIDQLAIELSEALEIVNVLGDMLVEKTIASGTQKNFDAICKGEMATAYAGFAASSAIQTTMYLSYLMNVYALVGLCVKNVQELDTFIVRLEDEVRTIGLAYEDAQTYERLVKNCYGSLEALEEYLIYLAECASDSVIDHQVDAIVILKNASGDQIDDQIKTMFEKDFGIKNFSSIVEHCKSFLELAETVRTTLGIDDSIQTYTKAYEVCGSSNIFYIDVDDVMGNVETLLTENSNTSVTTTTGYTSAPLITQAQVEQKINKLVELLDKKYFTTTQKSCGNNSCSYCYNENVFASTWFKDLFGKVSVKQIPGHAYPNGKSGTPAGWTCHGFANFAMWYIFSSSNSNQVKYTRIVDNVKLTKDNLQKYAKVGDVIRYGNHTVVLISINDSNFTVLDCNAQISGDGYARVRKHNISYSGRENYVMAVSRATNYNISQANSLTVNYNANGGSITEAVVVGETYKVTDDAGVNVRATAGTSGTKLGAITKGTTVTVTEKKVSGDYTWGKISYNGMTGWIALDSEWITKTGTVYSPNYYLVGNQIYKKSTSKLHIQACTLGVQVTSGLYNDTTFGLYRDGYTFKGWSFSATGGTVIDQNMAFKPEDIVPSVANGNVTVTAYAVWEQNIPPVTDHTVESIYISSIPKKDVYYVGDQIDLSAIKLIVKHTDGSFEQVTSGFVCTPATIAKEGKQDITVTYQGKTATFSITATKSKDRTNNATAKKDTTGYRMPSLSAATIKNEGAWKNDSLQVLCKDGDFYLCFVPWKATVASKTNGVLFYLKAEDVQLNSAVSNADEYYSMKSISATVVADSKIYFKPDGGANPVIYAEKPIAENTVSKNTVVKVLFEIDGYYCIQTDKYTGFVNKSSVKLDPVPYTVSASVSNITVNKGETVNTSSITVTETMTDGITAAFPAKDCTVILPSTATVGQKKIVITKDGLSVLVNLSVVEPQVTSITIEKTPTKMVYALGESFDSAGLVVKATYDNGAIEDITSKVTFAYAFEGEGESLIGVKYGSFSKYFSVKVYEKPTVSLADIDGYAGQTIKIPIFFFANEEIIVPATFDITISYDSAKLQYMGIENSDLYTVTAVDGNTLRIVPKNSSAILDYVLANLLFKLQTDTACYNTSAEITIDQLTLSDSLGNQYASVLGNGQISNLGQIAISFFATDDTDAEFMVKKANYGEIIQIPDTIPVLTGFVFKGWKDIQNKTYQPRDPIIATENLALYAVWETAAYSVTYNANGGANAPAAQTKTHGTDLTLSSVIPTRAGYTFIGWSANSEATTAEYSAGGSYTANSDITFYAVWEEIVEDTTTSTSESTRETTSTSESTRETTSTSESTRETTSTSESTRETTSTSESAHETTSTSESTRETTSTSESACETTSTSESTRETTSTSESTRETTSTSESTRETTSVSESTRETTSTSESTRETTSTSESTTVTTNTTEFTSMSQSSDSTSTTITTEENKGNDKSEKQPLISDTAVVVIVIGICIGGVLFFVIRKRKLV